MKSVILAAVGSALFLPLSPSFAAEKEAIFAGGCFWCIEKDFEYVTGVREVVSGYIGGDFDKPTYKNHAKYGFREAVKIYYDDTKTDYATLLKIFWRTVDPTDAGGQFCDRGFNYSTAVYALNEKQLELAKASKKQAIIDLKLPIVTEITLASKFTDAEKYHQDYYKKKPVHYRLYRKSCGRDARVKSLWGDQAYFGVKYGS